MAATIAPTGQPIRIRIDSEHGGRLVAHFSVEKFPELRIHLQTGGKGLGSHRSMLAKAYNHLTATGHAEHTTAPRQLARGQIRQLLRSAWELGRRLVSSDEAGRLQNWLRVALLVADRWEVEASMKDMIGLDLLPLGWLDDELPEFLYRNKDLTVSQLAGFLPGGAWPVSRRWLNYALAVGNRLPQSDPGEKVRVAFVGDDQCGNEGVSQFMRKHHRSLKHHPQIKSLAEVEAHWPHSIPVPSDQITANLARHLCDATRMPCGRHLPASPASTTHFFCHGDTKPDHDADQFALLLGHYNGRKHHRITMSSLREALHAARGVAAGSLPFQHQQRSLIFLNACSVAQQSAMDHGSVVGVFAENQHPSVIGTETSIDVVTANRTSLRFYEEFLSGCDASEALFRTKQALLDEKRPRLLSPAVLIYSCYGQPSTRLNIPNRTPFTADIAMSVPDFFFPSEH